MSRKLDLTVDPHVFEELFAFQKDLPARSTGSTKKDGLPSYDHPAGIALLGMRDNRVDTIYPLAMSGGCWDAPNINHNDMYKGLMKALKDNRIVAGMALVRHPRWHENIDSSWNAKMPGHLKSQIHGLRNSFEDITKSIWIVVHSNYFRVYRPSKDQDGRVSIREMTSSYIFDENAKEHRLIKKKLSKDQELRELNAKRKKEREEANRKWQEEQERYRQESEERERKLSEKRQKKIEEVNFKLKEGSQDIIDAGGGMVFMKDKEGKYILWQTAR